MKEKNNEIKKNGVKSAVNQNESYCNSGNERKAAANNISMAAQNERREETGENESRSESVKEIEERNM